VNAEQTCWTLVEAAGTGNPHARELFARVYLPVVRAYLRSRWGGGPRSAHVDDAVQETFVECFRENGALGKVERSPTDKFRTFLFAVVRNVALRFEERSAREHARRPSEPAPLEAVPSGEERASRAFDRAWAEEPLRRAAERQEAKARARGPEAVRRVELLRLRFQEDLPIRDIAARWNVDAAHLHREYAKARDEFKEALTEEIGFHQPGRPGDAERECQALLELLE
jgi:RNA polymerase sigma factor (sigma-70 family)